MIKKSLLSLLLILVTSSAFMSCDSEDPIVDERATIVQSIGDNVIIPIYHDLEEKGNLLLAAVKALRADPTVANRDAARAAWVAARSPFEMGEAFEFGPIKQPPPGLKPYVDTWPVATTGENSIESYLADSSNFTKENVANYPLNVRGYHAIEFILWGDADNGIAPKMDANALHYLEVMTEVTVEKMNEIHEAWEASGGNYINNLKEFGDGKAYPTVKDALLQINERVYHITEELWDEYLFDPIDPGHGPRSAESYLSDNSYADFRDIMVGVKAVYYGDYKQNIGKGLTDFYAEKDAALDATIRTQIDEAIAAIDALDPFNATVKNTPAKVQTAIDKCKALYQTLKNQGEPLISAS
jgi:putative iron-regulated protein